MLDFVFCCEQCTQQRQVSPLSEQPPESEGDKSNKRRPKILPSSFSEKEAHWRLQLNIFYASQTMLHIPAKYGSTQGKCCIELAKMGMVRKICLESSMDKIEIRCRCNTTCNFLQDLTCYRGMPHGTFHVKNICVHHLDCLGCSELWCKRAIYIWAHGDIVLTTNLKILQKTVY